MANVKNNSAAQETRRRLLASAGEVFADRGYHAATIQEITDRAGASLASVNYHFGDKAELYAAVLRKLADESMAIIPPAEAMTGEPANRLRQFIRHFFTSMMGRRREPWEQVLIAREVAEPTGALDTIYDQVMRPLTETLSQVIADLLGVERTAPAVDMATASVLGQCFYYMKQRQQFCRIHPNLAGEPDPEAVAAHIAAFSLAGIKAQRKQLST